MLSRKIVASFLNANASSSRKIDDKDKKVPASFYSYRDFFGHMKEASDKNLDCTRSALGAQMSVDLIPKIGEGEKASEILKLSKGVEDGLRHVFQLDRIKQKREAARMKYQTILLKRSSSNNSATSSVNSSCTNSTINSTTSSIKSSGRKKKKLKKPKLLRVVSEIDEGDGSSLIEAEAMIPSSVTSNDEELRPLSPLSVDMMAVDANGKMHRPFSPMSADMSVDANGKIFRPFSPMSVDAVPGQMRRPFSPMSETSLGGYTSSSKKRPHVKKYASEYNRLVSAVSKLLDSKEGPNNSSDSPDGGVIKFGSLKKITHMDVGVGFDIFVELRPGMMTYYKKDAGGERNVDVASVPIKCGRCRCRPTKDLKRTPFPMWNAVFEVSVKGYPTVFLMAEKSAKRKEWMDAFAKAVHMGKDKAQDLIDEKRQDVNAEHETRSSGTGLMGRNADILLYLHVRGLIQGVCSKDEYMESLSILLEKTITIPIIWLGEYFEDSPSTFQGPEDTPEEWERLSHETLSVNGHIMKGGIDDTIGSIKSHLIDLDKCSCSQDGTMQSRIKESQAVFFARDILLSCDRVKSKEQSIYCSSKMLANENLAFLTPSSEDIEPLKISLKRLKKGQGKRDGVEIAASAVERLKLDEYASSRDCDCTVEVTVRVPSIYRICNTDLLDKESWALMRTIHIQKFVLGPTEFQRMDRFVQFEIVP